MDVVNRGKPTQAVAAPRPLHGFTYRFRNPKHSRDYGAAQHLYEMLYHARNGAGQKAIEHLNHFFFQGHDKVTGGTDSGAVLDVETQALLRLLDQVEDAAGHAVPAARASRRSALAPRISSPRTCSACCSTSASFPRSVMVDYLKVLLAFHLGALSPAPAQASALAGAPEGRRSSCATACPVNPKSADDPHGDCPYRVGHALSMSRGSPERRWRLSRSAARTSTTGGFPTFVKRVFHHPQARRVRDRPCPAGEAAEARRAGSSRSEKSCSSSSPRMTAEREKFFGQRMYGLIQDTCERQRRRA